MFSGGRERERHLMIFSESLQIFISVTFELQQSCRLAANMALITHIHGICTFFFKAKMKQINNDISISS